MKNYVQPGKVLDLTAPAAIISGQALVIGSLFVVAQADAASGEKFAGLAEGVVTIPKLATDVMAEGAKVNWNTTTKQLQLATSDLDGVGSVVEAAGNGTAEVKIKLTQI